MTTESVPEAQPRTRRRGIWLFVRDIVVIVLVAALVSFLVKSFLVRSFYIPSGSMEQSLLVNDRILVDELTPLWNDYQRGDIVVFQDPGGWLPPAQQKPDRGPLMEALDGVLTFVGFSASDSEDHLVKRIIGLPGDHVVCCNELGQIEVNGVGIDESAYLNLPEGETSASREPFDVTVPEGSLWLLGDNRTRSTDARAHQDLESGGFVPIDLVVGKAFFRTWPLDRLGGIDAHTEVFRGVPDPEE